MGHAATDAWLGLAQALLNVKRASKTQKNSTIERRWLHAVAGVTASACLALISLLEGAHAYIELSHAHAYSRRLTRSSPPMPRAERQRRRYCRCRQMSASVSRLSLRGAQPRPRDARFYMTWTTIADEHMLPIRRYSRFIFATHFGSRCECLALPCYNVKNDLARCRCRLHHFISAILSSCLVTPYAIYFGGIPMTISMFARWVYRSREAAVIESPLSAANASRRRVRRCGFRVARRW